MKRILSSVVFGLLIVGVACGKGRADKQDTTLNTDLSLAAQQRGYQPIDSLADTARLQPGAPRAAAPRTSSSYSAAPSHHARTSSGGSSGSSAGSSAGTSTGTASTTAPSGGTVVKHTKRDAAIGAAAGAILGATTSKNKVKGGVIGAAVGGILGGVIGNNVDKKKKP